MIKKQIKTQYIEKKSQLMQLADYLWFFFFTLDDIKKHTIIIEIYLTKKHINATSRLTISLTAHHHTMLV